MPLFPNTPFIEGQIVTPDLLYTAYNPVFDDQPQYLGHLPRLSDDSLSNSAGAIKDRLNAVTGNFRVSRTTGLTLRYAKGILVNNDELVSLEPGLITLPPNSRNHVFIDINNTVQYATRMPAARIMLAFVVTSATGVESLVDLRSGGGYPVILPSLRATVTFGGQGEDGVYTAVNGAVLPQGDYSFASFVVPAGVLLTIKRFAKIRVSGQVRIEGTVFVEVPVITTGGIFSLTPGIKLSGTANSGLGSRAGEIPANTYSPVMQSFGSDGCNGSVLCSGTSGSYGTPARPGGAGGGGFIVECGSSITLGATGRILCKGLSGAEARLGESSPQGFIIAGASSGGSGGYVALKALEQLTVAGHIDVSGGTGGAGVLPNGVWAAESGCGGGGGVIELISPFASLLGTADLVVSGGGAGASAFTTLTSVPATINTPGGSFGGLGGSAAGIPGAPGAAGYYTLANRVPTPS